MARTLFDKDQVVDEDFISPNETLDNPIYTYVYADENDFNDATGFDTTDIGKIAYIEDTKALWILTNDNPIEWSTMGGSGASHERAHSLTNPLDHYDVSDSTALDGYVLVWSSSEEKWRPTDIVAILSSGVIDNDGNSVYNEAGELVQVVI